MLRFIRELKDRLRYKEIVAEYEQQLRNTVPTTLERLELVLQIMQNYNKRGVLPPKDLAVLTVLVCPGHPVWHRGNKRRVLSSGICYIVAMLDGGVAPAKDDLPTLRNFLHSKYPKLPATDYPIKHPKLDSRTAFNNVQDLWAGKYGANRLAMLREYVEWLNT